MSIRRSFRKGALQMGSFMGSVGYRDLGRRWEVLA